MNFRGKGTRIEFARYVLISALGFVWGFLWLYVPIDVLGVRISVALVLPVVGVFVVDTWKVFFVVGAVFGLFHNFFLNKLLGGISKFGEGE